MAKFKFSNIENQSFETPQEMFNDYKNRKITAIFDYQSKMIDQYLKNGMSCSDVALELPTGTGKTLVGLLIGEFRRRKSKEKVVYLCPNKQLVHQTVQHANADYGINALAYTGSIREYTPEQRARYQTAECIAVTTYSSLFNSNPFFHDADLLIFDDAHSGEGYVASNWTVAISKTEHNKLYFTMIDALKSALESEVYERLLNGEQHSTDIFWVDKIPNTKLLSCISKINDVIVQYINSNPDTNIKYPWSMIEGHLKGCNIFVSFSELSIRPFIPPTMNFAPFANAKQRLYMSATLGKSGELERAFGVTNITKLPIVKDWENRTIGRRFFLFPLASFKDSDLTSIILSMLSKVKRSLIIVNDDNTQDLFIKLINKHTSKKIYTARDIEKTKDSFVSDSNAVAIVANRFDGIDFPDEECRLEILFDLQNATHIQERFLTSRMGSMVLFSERIKTRLVQGFGRCTRSYADYAAVCIVGEDLANAIISPKKLAQFNPELQAELMFGHDNSVGQQSLDEYLELLDVFLFDRKQWDQAEQDIIARRDRIIKQGNPVDDAPLTQLYSASKYEIEAQYSLWREDFSSALINIKYINDTLKHESLKGYSGFWHYIAAYCAYNLYMNDSNYYTIYKNNLEKASRSTLSITWFNKLLDKKSSEQDKREYDYVIESIENKIAKERFRYSNQKGLFEFLDRLITSLETSKGEDFETPHCELGKWMGYYTMNPKGDSDPDPIWVINRDLCIISEDKIYEDSSKAIPTRHVRQAAGHCNWVKENSKELNITDKAECITVFISNSSTIEKSAAIHGREVYYLSQTDVINWAKKFIQLLKKSIISFDSVGDIIWRDELNNQLMINNLTSKDFVNQIKQKTLDQLKKTVSKTDQEK